MKIQLTVIAMAILAILLLGTIISKNTYAVGRASYDGQADEDIIVDYCVAHADRVAAGENVVKDLVNSGLVSSFTFGDKTCEDVRGLQSTANFQRCSEVYAIIRGEPLDPDC